MSGALNNYYTLDKQKQEGEHSRQVEWCGQKCGGSTAKYMFGDSEENKSEFISHNNKWTLERQVGKKFIED